MDPTGSAGVQWRLRPLLPLPQARWDASLDAHSGSVTAVAVSSDARSIVSGGDDSAIRMWDRSGGTAVGTLRGHDAAVRCVALTHDGRRVVSGSVDRTVRVWDARTGEALYTCRGHEAAVHGVAVSRDGRWAISASGDRTLRIWELDGGALVRVLEGHAADVYAVAVSEDARWIFSGSSDATARVWDRQTGAVLATLQLEGSMVWVYAIAACDGGRVVFAGAYDGLREWRWQSGAVRALNIAGYSGQSVAAANSGRLAVCRGRAILVLDRSNDATVATFEGHSAAVNSLAIGRDGTWLVSGAGDGTVKVWDLHRPPAREPAAQGRLLVSPDGRSAAVQSGGVTKLWDTARAQVVGQLPGDHWGRALVHSSGRWWVVTSELHVVTLWDVAGGKKRQLAGEIRCDCAQASWDGTRLVAGSDDWGDDPFVVWDLNTGRTLLTPDTGAAFAVAISGDGRRAAGGFNGTDPRIRVWDVDTKVEVHSWEGFSKALALSFDGARCLAAVRGDGRIWDTATGRLQSMLTGHASTITCVALAGDGGIAVTGSEDKTLRAWDAASGATLAVFRADAPIDACAISADGRTITAACRLSHVYFLRLEAS